MTKVRKNAPLQDNASPNTQAQRRVANKRKESGLGEIKLYLDYETTQMLQKLATDLGYPTPDSHTKKRFEILSQCVTYCVHMTMSEHNVMPESRLALEYNRLYQIAEHRQTVERENDEEIARFMTENKYISPNGIRQQYKSSEPAQANTHRNWSAAVVESLLDPETFQKRLKTLNKKRSP